MPHSSPTNRKVGAKAIVIHRPGALGPISIAWALKSLVVIGNLIGEHPVCIQQGGNGVIEVIRSHWKGH